MGYYSTMYKINHNLTSNLKMEQIKTICVNVFLADKQCSEMIQIMYYTSPLDEKKNHIISS